MECPSCGFVAKCQRGLSVHLSQWCTYKTKALALRTSTGTPQVANDDEVDHNADIYSSSEEDKSHENFDMPAGDDGSSFLPEQDSTDNFTVYTIQSWLLVWIP